MKKSKKEDLETKYKSIFSREQSLARSVAQAVIKSRPISVWEVMIPILLVFSYAKSKENKEAFARNFLFTKKLALKASLDRIKKSQPKDEIMSRVEEETEKLLASVREGLYSREVRQMQLSEISLLIDHYCRLFQAEGEDYASWVINAYGSQDNYTAFLGQLKEAEKEVYLAAVQTVGTQTSGEIVLKMEEATEKVRMAAAEKIFRPMNCQQYAK